MPAAREDGPPRSPWSRRAVGVFSGSVRSSSPAPRRPGIVHCPSRAEQRRQESGAFAGISLLGVLHRLQFVVDVLLVHGFRLAARGTSATAARETEQRPADEEGRDQAESHLLHDRTMLLKKYHDS